MDVSFLKKKELGLPIWAWGIIVAVFMFLLYRHYKNAGSSSASSNTLGTSTTPDTTPVDTGSGSAGDSGSGGIGGDTGAGAGGGTDTSGGLAALASVLAPEGAYYQSLLDGLQGGTTPLGGDTTTGTNPMAAQTTGFNPLLWNDVAFKTRSQFDSYLKSKGLTVATFAKKHPAAYKVYKALPAGKPSGAKSGTSGTVRASVVSAVRKTTTPGASRTPKATSVTTPHGASTPAKPSKATAKKAATVTKAPVRSTATRRPVRHTAPRKTPR